MKRRKKKKFILTGIATESYYENTAVYSVGGYGMLRF